MLKTIKSYLFHIFTTQWHQRLWNKMEAGMNRSYHASLISFLFQGSSCFLSEILFALSLVPPSIHSGLLRL